MVQQNPHITSLALFLASTLACGSDPQPTPPAPPTPTVAPTPTVPTVPPQARRDAPAALTATTDRVELVHLTWAAPISAPGLSGYRVLRDGRPLTEVPAAQTTHGDRTATAATLSGPKLTASDGTRETGVLLSWEPLGPNGEVAVHTYTVVALYGTEASVPSSSAKGSRPGPVTGYDLSLDDGVTWTSLPGLATSHEDATAPLVHVTFPAPVVTPDDPRSLVRLELPSHATAGAAKPVSYRVRARAGDRVGAPSAPSVGRRGPGRLDAMAIQWQRSSSTTDAGYSDVTGVTGRVWVDTTAPTETRFFRARASASWAEGTSAAASGRAMTWKRIATRQARTCGIRASDDSIVCWGQPWNGSPIPSGAFKELAIGDLGGCATRIADDRALCWGTRNGLGEPVPTEPSPEAFVSLAASDVYMCGIRRDDGKGKCWGGLSQYFDGQESASALSAIAVGGSNDRACGLRIADNRHECWHPRFTGDIGGYPGAPHAYKAIALGRSFACFVRASDDRIECHGPTPPLFLSAGTYEAMSAGEHSLCALSKGGRKLQCWGISGDRHAPIQPTVEGYDQLAFSGYHTCALKRTGHLQCWGGNTLGQAPTTPIGDTFGAISVFGWGGLGQRPDGKLLGWGGSVFEAVPEHPTTETFLSYSSTGDHTCGIRASDKKAVCFGYMVTGIEGPSTDAYDVITTPYQAVCGVRASDKKILCRGQGLGTLPGSPTAETATQLASYYSAICAVLGTGRLKCWPGQGGGMVVPADPPDNGTDTYSTVAMGPSGLCAIRTGSAEARCWAGSLAPPAGVAFKALAVGQDEACGIRATDDRIECWNDQTVSVDPFRSVSISSQGSVCGARLSDGKLVCVGPNHYGEAPTL